MHKVQQCIKYSSKKKKIFIIIGIKARAVSKALTLKDFVRMDPDQKVSTYILRILYQFLRKKKSLSMRTS